MEAESNIKITSQVDKMKENFDVIDERYMYLNVVNTSINLLKLLFIYFLLLFLIIQAGLSQEYRR